MAKSKDKKIIGIDIGSSSIKAVALSYDGIQYSCLGIKIHNFQFGAEVSEQLKIDGLKEILSSFNKITKNIVLVSSDREIKLKFLTKPFMDKKTLDQVMKNESGMRQTGVSSEASSNANLYTIVGEQDSEKGKNYHILSIACPISYLQKQQAMVKKAGGKLLGLYPTGIAVRECLMANYGDEITEKQLPYLVALLNFGANQNQITVCDGNILRLSRSFPFAGEDITKLLMKSYTTAEETFEFDRNMAEEYKTAIGILSVDESLSYPENALETQVSFMIERNFERMIQKLRLSLDYFKGQMKVNVQKAFIFGGGANMHGISEKLKDGIMVDNIVELSPLNKINYSPVDSGNDPSPEVVNTLVHAIGGAICMMQPDHEALNLMIAIRTDFQKIVKKVALKVLPFLVVFLAALVLPALYAWQILYPENIEMVKLKKQHLSLSSEFAQVASFKEQYDKLIKAKVDWEIRSEFINKTVNKRMFWSDVLFEIEAVLPKEIWLSYMATGDFANGTKKTYGSTNSFGNQSKKVKKSTSKVTLKGSSYSHQAISKFVENLEKSRTFYAVKWLGSFRDEESKSKDIQFSVTFKIRKSVINKKRHSRI